MTDQLLQQIAATLRAQIAPAVGEPYAKTQAFMAAVILEKLAAQLRLAATHAEADREDRAELAKELGELLPGGAPAALREALADLDLPDGDRALARVVAAIYAAQAELGPERTDSVLTRVRATLRARLDRQLEYSS